MDSWEFSLYCQVGKKDAMCIMSQEMLIADVD